MCIIIYFVKKYYIARKPGSTVRNIQEVTKFLFLDITDLWLLFFLLLTHVTTAIFLLFGIGFFITSHEYKNEYSNDQISFRLIIDYFIWIMLLPTILFVSFLNISCSLNANRIPFPIPGPILIEGSSDNPNFTVSFWTLVVLTISSFMGILLVLTSTVIGGYIKSICVPKSIYEKYSCLSRCNWTKHIIYNVILISAVAAAIINVSKLAGYGTTKDLAKGINIYGSNEIGNERFMREALIFMKEFIFVTIICFITGFISLIGSISTFIQTVLLGTLIISSAMITRSLESEGVYPVPSLIISPIMLCLFVRNFKSLRKLSGIIITVFISTFDFYTDILVVTYWIYDEDYSWAAIQIFILLFSQLMSVIHFRDTKRNNKKYYNKCFTILEYLFTLTGLGRNWYTVLSFTFKDFNIMMQTVKVWELMYESFPSLTLQMYLIMSQNTSNYSNAVIASILSIFLNATLSVWFYLLERSTKTDALNTQTNTSVINVLETPKEVQLTEVTGDENGEQNTGKPTAITNDTDTNDNTNRNRIRSTSDGMPTKKEHKTPALSLKENYEFALKNKKFLFSLYIFMFSDLYLRTFPVVAIISFMRRELFINALELKIGIISVITALIFIIYFILMGIFEWYQCKLMRAHNNNIYYYSNKHIFKIFFISILSSFYNLLCCVKFLKNDPFFGMSVDYNKHIKEHIIRMIISILLVIIWIGLSIKFGLIPLYTVMFILYAVFLIWNIIASYYVKQHITTTNNIVSNQV